MEQVLHYRAMEAFCRQRAKMDGEDESFWLTEAEVQAKLAKNMSRVARRPVVAPLDSRPD
jgi:hypothetical protein